MTTDHVKATLMGGWILTIGTLGYIAGATSFTAWIALAMLSLAPPVVMARLGRAAAPSMSESIREVLR